MPIERCPCGAKAENSCNDCEAQRCDACITADFRCTECAGANAEGSNLFDDPEAEDFDPNDPDAQYLKEQDAFQRYD